MSHLAAKTFDELRNVLAARLPEFLEKQRWFGGKARRICSTVISDVIPMRQGKFEALLLIVEVIYASGGDDKYALPVAVVDSTSPPSASTSGMLALSNEGSLREIVDATKQEEFLELLLDTIRGKSTWNGEQGHLQGLRSAEFSRVYADLAVNANARVLKGEQSNTSVIYGDRLILKFFRRLEDGVNPDLEIGKFVTEKAHFAHVPELAGHLEYRGANGTQTTLGILQAFVPNQGDAWRHTLKSLTEFYGQVLSQIGEAAVSARERGREDIHELPESFRHLIKPNLTAASLLGQRTAELHVALASDTTDPAFAPEPFTPDFQQGLLASALQLNESTSQLLRDKIPTLPSELRDSAERIASSQEQIQEQFRAALSEPIDAMRARIHGDYHLGQVLYTGSDFVIIDFEGEPARTLAERRMKRSPMQDVAGMMRSFHYAAFAPLMRAAGENAFSSTDVKRLGAWAEAWNAWVTNAFVESYFKTARSAVYLPRNPAQLEKLLQFHLLEKAVYELGYELNNRPTWVGIPLKGIEQLLSE